VSAKVDVLTKGSYIFDAATFVLVQAPEGVNQLVPASERPLWPERLDMNLDGAIDNVDYTHGGEIFAEMTRVHCAGCPGAHDTQFRWGVGLPWNASRFAAVATLAGVMDGGRSACVAWSNPFSAVSALLRHSEMTSQVHHRG
jgi:hypothetical protein